MAESRVRSSHHCHHGLGHILTWNKDHKPVMSVDSGSEVAFDTCSAGFKNITRDMTAADLADLNIRGLQDLEKLMGPIYVDGPVFINDAKPGDTLKVEILALETADWGWTLICPGNGIFMDEFKEAHIKIYDLPPGQDYTTFKEGIHIPLQPFYGTIGVASADEGDFPALFPRDDIGGNIDCRYIGEGSTLYLPVNVPGALFAVGDGHFAQGDSEICGTAIETMVRSRIRLTVIKGKPALTSPHYDTSVQRVVEMHSVRGKGEHGVVATAADQPTTVKKALERVMEWLVVERGLSKVEAYMLISVAGNLKIMHELGLSVPTVSASIPLGIFID